jgi:hypothetical protein
MPNAHAPITTLIAQRCRELGLRWIVHSDPLGQVAKIRFPTLEEVLNLHPSGA